MQFFKSFSTLSIIAFLAIIFFSGCNGCSTQPADNTLKVGYIPIAECLQLYVAKEQGFFEQEGLNVELMAATKGSEILRDLNANTVQVGFSNVVSMLKQSEQYNVVSIFGATYETMENQNHAFFVSAKQNIKSVADLKGKSIAINASKNIEQLMASHYLFQNKLAISDISFIETPFPQMLPLLSSGKVDAVCVVEPFITVAKRDSQTYRYIGNQYLNNGRTKVLVATYVTTSEFTVKSKDKAAKFTNAMKRATDFINNNIGKAKEILPKYVKIDPAIVTDMNLPLFEKSISPQSLQEILLLAQDERTNYISKKDINVSKLIYE